MSESIGARLRQARELRRLSIAQVSETTKVRPYYIQALENDDLSAIPSAAQARGFLRLYAEFLELNPDELLPAAQAARGEPRPAAPIAVQPAPEAAARPSLWSSLRERLAARPRQASAETSAPAATSPVAEPAAPEAASADASTTPRTASDAASNSTDVKKKELSELAPAVEATAPSAQAVTPADAEPGSAPGLLSRVRDWLARRRDVLPAQAHGDGAPEPAVDPGEIMQGARDFNPAPAPVDMAAKSSAGIFAEIGQQLRQRREMLSLTHEEIERHIHIRTAFLAGLEAGALEDLPSPVQTRGILDNYAKFLDLDADAIMLRFADGLQARYREKGSKNPARSRRAMTVHTTLPPLRAFIASDLVFGIGLAALLLLFAVWGISRVLAVRSETAARVAPPSISDVLSTELPTFPAQVTVIPAQQTVAAVVVEASPTLELATLAPNIKVQVDVTASERTYMRVLVNGKVQFEGRTDPAAKYTYQASDQVEIISGNGAALHVIYNSQDLGTMGEFGEVVDRLYTAGGVATPTSTPQPTRTPTPFVTGTPTETPTVTPSITRTP